MIVLYILAALLFLYIIIGICYSLKFETLYFQLKNGKISKIKTDDGYKIVYFSDLHIGKSISKKKLKKYVDFLIEQEADLYIFGGDFLGYKYECYSLDEIKEIFAPFKNLNVIGVYGNHEYKKIKDFNKANDYLKASNIRFMKDEIYDFYGLNINMFQESIYHKLDKNKANGLCIIHEGDNFDKIDGNYLMLSGHTHGGQIRLFPFYIYLPVDGKKYVKGLYQNDGKQLIVSKGIGNSLLDFRFYCQKDIVIIDYVGEKNASN